MDGFNFTSHVREALRLAREEAVRLRHNWVDTGHMLLGLLHVEDCVGVELLRRQSAKPDAIRDSVEAVVKAGDQNVRIGLDLRYTERARKIFELAMIEARDLEDTYVGTEHLLLGLLLEEKGIGAQALALNGVTLAATRSALVKLREDNPRGS